MSFTWTEDIGVGSSIDVADIQEIRGNVDTVDDTKCKTYNSGVLTDDHGTYKSGDKPGYDSTYRSGYNSPVNITVYSGENGTYRDGHKDSDNGTYYSSDDSPQNVSVRSPDFP